MAGDVIQDFLISLGFTVDTASLAKFQKGMGDSHKAIAGFAKGAEDFIGSIASTVLALASAAAAMTAFVAKSAATMEALWFSAQRANETANGLHSLEYAFTQIGMAAGAADQTLASFALSLRDQPGLAGVLTGMGVALGDTKSEFFGFLDAISKMPAFEQDQWGSQFGISPSQMRDFQNNRVAMEQADRQSEAWQKRYGATYDKWATVSHQFMETSRQLSWTLGVMFDSVAGTILEYVEPTFQHFVNWLTNSGIPEANKFADAIGGWKTILEAIGDVILYRIFGPLGLAAALAYKLYQWEQGQEGAHPGPKKDDQGNVDKTSPQTKNFFDDNHQMTDDFRKFLYHWIPPLNPDYDKGGGTAPATHNKGDGTAPATHNKGDGTAPATHKQSWWGNLMDRFTGGGKFAPSAFKTVEGAAGLPAGLLDRIWSAESGRGRYMLSGAGAMGHFQFMPATARQYGLADPNDLGSSAVAAAHYMTDLLNKFHGNLREAVASYNWGEGNVARDLARWGEAWEKHLPNETQNYLGKVLGGEGPTLGQSARRGARWDDGGTARGGGDPTVHFNQTNHIQSTAPREAGQEVAIRTRGAWPDIIRNMKSQSLVG